MEKREVIELLKKIGVVNEIKEVMGAQIVYENKVSKSYEIVTEYGGINFRVMQLEDGVYSKLDYFNNDYKFNRNVNLLHVFEK